MGWLDWFRNRLTPSQPSRNVSSLPDADDVAESIDTSGEPLKENHLRRGLRDRRLLPKRKPQRTPAQWLRGERPRYLGTAEARRRFGGTLRTRNRDIGDLVADEEQLERYGLPVWHSEGELASSLGLTESALQHYSIHRDRETTPHYVTFATPKRSGGHRLIHAPKSRLKAILRKLDVLLVKKLPNSPAAHGFRTGRSVATHAQLHVGKQVVVKLDLRECFPSIHFGRVRGLLVAMGYGYTVATTLAVLMTEAERQPVVVEGVTYHVPVGPRYWVQGAPTSPGLCNAILMRADRRLLGLAKRFDFQYSRYADDLAFSGTDPQCVKRLIRHATEILEDEGFRVNPRKTQTLRRGRRQRVTGVVVNDQAGLSKTERRKIRAAIHQLNTSDRRAIQSLQGKIAYVSMLNARQGARLAEAFSKRMNHVR